MVRHAPIHRRSGHSDIAICCGRNVRGSSPSTSVVPLSNQVTTLNHKRFKGFKMFSDGHLGPEARRGLMLAPKELPVAGPRPWAYCNVVDDVLRASRERVRSAAAQSARAQVRSCLEDSAFS